MRGPRARRGLLSRCWGPSPRAPHSQHGELRGVPGRWGGGFPDRDAMASSFGSAASPLPDGPGAQNPARSVLGETQAQVAKRFVHSAARLGLASETEGLSGGGGLQVRTGRDTCGRCGEAAVASDRLPSEAGSS